jgi:hypothetical protein
LFTMLVQQLLSTRKVDLKAIGDLSFGGLVQQ